MTRPSDTTGLVDSIAAKLKDSWHSREREVIERCLEDSPEYAKLDEVAQHELLLAIVHLEVEVRRKLGQSPSCSEYLQRFPMLDSDAVNDLLSLPAPPPQEITKKNAIDRQGSAVDSVR